MITFHLTVFSTMQFLKWGRRKIFTSTAAFQLQNLRGEEQRTLLRGRLRLSHSTSNEIVFITARVLQAIFNALVYPYLTFGNIVWASTYPTSLEGIYKIQKKIVRIATFSKDTQETRSLFLSLNVQTIYELSSYHWNYSCILTLVDNCRHLYSDWFSGNNTIYYMAESVFAMRLVNLRSVTCYTDQNF